MVGAVECCAVRHAHESARKRTSADRTRNARTTSRRDDRCADATGGDPSLALHRRRQLVQCVKSVRQLIAQRHTLRVNGVFPLAHHVRCARRNNAVSPTISFHRDFVHAAVAVIDTVMWNVTARKLFIPRHKSTTNEGPARYCSQNDSPNELRRRRKCSRVDVHMTVGYVRVRVRCDRSTALDANLFAPVFSSSSVARRPGRTRTTSKRADRNSSLLTHLSEPSPQAEAFAEPRKWGWTRRRAGAPPMLRRGSRCKHLQWASKL